MYSDKKTNLLFEYQKGYKLELNNKYKAYLCNTSRDDGNIRLVALKKNFWLRTNWLVSRVSTYKVLKY